MRLMARSRTSEGRVRSRSFVIAILKSSMHGGCAVLPGFVDAHTHLVFAGNRLEDFESRARGETYEQIAKRGGGIQTTVQATRASDARMNCSRSQKSVRAGFCKMERQLSKRSQAMDSRLRTNSKFLRVIRRVGAGNTAGNGSDISRRACLSRQSFVRIMPDIFP